MRFILALLLLLTVGSQCLANPPLDLSPEERAWLAEHKDSLTLSFDRSFPPIEFEKPDGSFTGLSADLVARIEERLGITFRKQGIPWTQALEGLQDGTTALAPAIVNNAERSEYTLFTQPFVRIPLVIVTSRHMKGPLSLDDLAGMRVAVVRGYASATLVKKAGQGRFTVVELETIREGLRDVSFGVVDAFVESLAVAAWHIGQEKLPNLRVAGDLDVTQDLSIGVSKHYPLLASAVAKALTSIPEPSINNITDRWIHLPTSFLGKHTLEALRLAALLTAVVFLVLAGIAWALSRTLRKKINDLKRTESALTEQVDRFRLALETTQAGFWEHYPAEGREVHSPEWYAMLGYTPQAVTGGVEDWTALIHPEEREKALASFSAYISEGGKGMYEAQYRLRAKDGSWRWIMGKGRAVSWDDEGRPTRIIGLNLDIQKSRQDQLEMQRTQTLNKALLEQTTQFIGLLDLQGNLLVANRTSMEWIKAKPEEVLGKPFWDGPWWPDKTKAEFLLLQLIDQVREGKTVRREIVHADSEGRESFFDFTMSPFRNETGQVVNFIVEGRDISMLKKKQQEIMESEKRFRTIFENAPYSMVITRLSDGKYMDANTAFLDRMNISRENLLTLSPKDVGTFGQAHQQEILLRLKASRNIHNMETQVQRPDGTTGHILYSGGLITLDGEACILSMTVDITELKQAQEELRRSKEMFARLFQLSPDIITLARQEDGVLLEVNETFSRTTGYSRDEALGKSTLDLTIFAAPERRTAFVQALLRDGQVDNFEFEMRHRDGHTLQCSTSARLMNIDDTPCILAITRDITHLRALQDSMIQSEKMLSLGGIAAGIAHEINNPLGIVLQAAQTITLRTRADFPKNIEAAAKVGADLGQVDRYLKERKVDVFIRDIQGAAVRAAEIIRHMLDFSRRSESRHSVCDIRVILENSLRLASSDYDLKKNYDFKSIRIEKDVEDNLPCLLCTETEIEQVLLNLLRNAAQAMAEAEPPLPDPCIGIRIRKMETGLRIDIRDNGPGISAENRKRIFEPFFTTKTAGAGTGLGLSVSYFIITKGHGGAMYVTAPAEGGTVFSIELPGTTESVKHEAHA
ncbi:PAS domain S-box protein [Desulfomicrobium baculatum]|uniref:histidine kinase n=1 Tax=Desulfomicrobium baculatum (strain DSM 4028 / VKM B-1378 / X) TaxID=525897 RepID=C7LQZ9_DESBD|nr:PAS domain S-box protein [Desulfomicrobium baculatum]ACU90405.1 PAS/PAC sensor signal transduction histidine kinase [Desulfomicrobium baculatum DSM 4028]